ncbi:bacterial regulatory helix-turn-helix, lysR family protein, partial [Vibrio parahaemolyticus EKP-021]
CRQPLAFSGTKRSAQTKTHFQQHRLY